MSKNTIGATASALLAPERRAFVVGVVLLAVFAAAVVFGLNATHGMPLAERKEVKVAFEDVSGLTVGDDVRIASTRVGFVDAIELEDGQAVVVLKIDDPETEIFTNAAARVTDRSGLGQKFVNLDPGTPAAGAMAEDGTIPEAQTVKAEDLNQLFDVFDTNTRKTSRTSLRNLGGGMTGHGEDLRWIAHDGARLLDDTGAVSEALATDSGAPLASMLESADRISARMRARSDELAALTQEFATTVRAFGVDGGRQVDGSLARSPKTLDTARVGLRALDQPLRDTAVAMRRLRPGARALGAATPDFRAFMREAVDPLEKVPPVNKDAVPAVGSLTELVEDARPVSKQLVKTGTTSAPFVSVLGAYSRDIAAYYAGAADTLSHGDSAGNWLRILLLPADIAGMPTTDTRDPYQPPGGSR